MLNSAFYTFWSSSDKRNAHTDTMVIWHKWSSILQYKWRIYYMLRVSPVNTELLRALCIVAWATLNNVLCLFWQKFGLRRSPKGRQCMCDTVMFYCCKDRPKFPGFHYHCILQQPELSNHFHCYSINYFYFFFATVFNRTEGLACFADKRSQSGSLGCQSTPALLKLFKNREVGSRGEGADS